MFSEYLSSGLQLFFEKTSSTLIISDIHFEHLSSLKIRVRSDLDAFFVCLHKNISDLLKGNKVFGKKCSSQQKNAYKGSCLVKVGMIG